MKVLKPNKRLFVIGLGLIVTNLGLVFVQGLIVHAATGSTITATAFCATKVDGTGATAQQQRDACVKGYVAGYDGGDKAKTCKDFQQSKKTACEDGFNSGKDKQRETDSQATAAKAKVYCQQTDHSWGTVPKNTGSANPQIDIIDTCTSGFTQGYDGVEKSKACGKGDGSAGAVFFGKICNESFAAGKAAKEKAPEIDGRDGAAAGASKADACKKYKNADNKKACEKSYDVKIIDMAQAEGKRAGTLGAASPCDSLTYGGAAAKNACDEAFTKGQNEAGKTARGHCGEGEGKVETYFDFTAICAGTDKKAGGNTSPIIAIALAVVGWVTALVAVAVAGGIIYGGFMYLTARDNTGQTEKGVAIITNAVVALIVWGFAYALINFLVPGGLFHG